MKKKISAALSLLLACFLLLSFSGMAGGEARAASAAQEKFSVGTVIEGFQVVERGRLDAAETLLLRHQKTGAAVLQLLNGDPNRTFQIAFRTPTNDDTGLAHVFEHATLSGSEKYPSASLFFNMIYQTYTSYMNAMTYDIMTAYPVASLSEKQLLKNVDFYLDSVFHPRVLKDKAVFEREGWRYALDSQEGELTLAGTVYSEMQGAYTMEVAASLNALKTLYPGARVGKYFGGVPARIPDMRWEDLIYYHNLYYHPSNSFTCLYGDLEELPQFLRLMDGYFCKFEKREFDFVDTAYRPLAEPVSAVYEYPVEAGADAEKAAAAHYGYLCAGADPIRLSMLALVMNAEPSAFQRALRERLPGSSGSCYAVTSGPEAGLMFSASGIEREQGPAFRQLVEDAVAQTAKQGWDQEMLDGLAANAWMETRLLAEGADAGQRLAAEAAYAWAAADGKPGALARQTAEMEAFDRYAANGTLLALLRERVLGNPRTALTVTVPIPGLREKEQAALQERLASTKAAMSRERLAGIVQATAQSVSYGENAAQYVEQLKAVEVAQLPQEERRYRLRDHRDPEGVRYLEAQADAAGLGVASLLLDARGAGQEQLHWLKLYADLAGAVGTEQYAPERLSAQIQRHLYNLTVELAPVLQKDGGYGLYLQSSWVMRGGGEAAAYELLSEVLFHPSWPEDLSGALAAVKGRLEQTITAEPQQILAARAAARDDSLSACDNYLRYLDYYGFLKGVEELLGQQPETVQAKLQEAGAFVQNRQGAVVLFAGDEAGAAANRAAAQRLLAGLPRQEREAAAYTFPQIARSEALVTGSAVQTNLMYASYQTLGLREYTADLDAACALVTDAFLYPMLRDRYGAYAVSNNAGRTGISAFTSSDPNVAQTFEVFGQTAASVAGLQPDQPLLDGYILSAYAALAKSPGELSGAMNALSDELTGFRQGRRTEWMRQLKAMNAQDFAKYAPLYQAMAQEGYTATAGGPAVIAANADRYETLLDPFAFEKR